MKYIFDIKFSLSTQQLFKQYQRKEKDIKQFGDLIN